MSKVVLFSGHYYNSKRRAGFHFLADAFKAKGFDVVFVTVPVSLLTFLKNDYKIYEKYFFKNLFRPIIFNGIKSIVNKSLLHPIDRNSKLIEEIGNMFFKLNDDVIKEVKTADYIVFESTLALLFFEQVKLINPKAYMIYRMSDDIEKLGLAKKVIAYERKILNQFDLVSVPTKSMLDKFILLSPNNVRLHYHGIDKASYDFCTESPYTSNLINHVFVGNSYLDENFIKIASELFPDHNFHIIGPFKKFIKRKNVIFYGQLPFEETIPYVKFASSGLQIRKNAKNVAETLADSLKVLQYTYCKLPIIAPSVIPAYHRKNFFYYEYNDKNSIKKCINNALMFDRSSFNSKVNNWEEIIEKWLLNED